MRAGAQEKGGIWVKDCAAWRNPDQVSAEPAEL